ncbi:hypothetical protein H0H93_002385 [Arthromyces matolae]|nr:hypothetical protein H0H93_002385 [Arthromyces matolae]
MESKNQGIPPLQWLSNEYYASLATGLNIPASELWSDTYLTERMGERQISVAVTPNGLADAVTRGPDDKLYFAEPLLQKMTMGEFLTNISAGKEDEMIYSPAADENVDSTSSGRNIYYLQSQNGNLFTSEDFSGHGIQSCSEFEPLRPDIPNDIEFCTGGLGRPPDAVNLWIGDGRSITSIHSDPYENIYTVLRGAKYFTLLPPTEGWCLKERRFPHATYQRCSKTGRLSLQPSQNTDLVRWSSVMYPHIPGALPIDAHPIHITLHPGDTLYLPAGWWHHVRQLSGATTIALNWWYDMEMRGMSWVTLSFLRGISEVPLGNNDEEDDDP